MFVRDSSNFYSKPYYKIMIIIFKTFFEHYINWHRISLWVYKLNIKISKDFMKIEVYIVHRMDRLLTLFHTTQLKL